MLLSPCSEMMVPEPDKEEAEVNNKRAECTTANTSSSQLKKVGPLPHLSTFHYEIENSGIPIIPKPPLSSTISSIISSSDKHCSKSTGSSADRRAPLYADFRHLRGRHDHKITSASRSTRISQPPLDALQRGEHKEKCRHFCSTFLLINEQKKRGDQGYHNPRQPLRGGINHQASLQKEQSTQLVFEADQERRLGYDHDDYKKETTVHHLSSSCSGRTNTTDSSTRSKGSSVSIERTGKTRYDCYKKSETLLLQKQRLEWLWRPPTTSNCSRAKDITCVTNQTMKDKESVLGFQIVRTSQTKVDEDEKRAKYANRHVVRTRNFYDYDGENSELVKKAPSDPADGIYLTEDNRFDVMKYHPHAGEAPTLRRRQEARWKNDDDDAPVNESKRRIVCSKQKEDHNDKEETEPQQEWVEYWDEEVGAKYYYNFSTGEATWVVPSASSFYNANVGSA